jgi:hypothetical protein
MSTENPAEIQQKLQTLSDGFNQAARTRFELIKRKLGIWNELYQISQQPKSEQREHNVNAWFQKFSRQVTVERRLVHRYKTALDEGLQEIVKINDAFEALPDSVKKNPSVAALDTRILFLYRLFKDCEGLIVRYENRIAEEEHLVAAEERHKLGKKFFKTHLANFMEEVKIETDILTKIQHGTEDLEYLQNVQAIKKGVAHITASIATGTMGGICITLPALLPVFAGMFLVWKKWIKEIQAFINKELTEFMVVSAKMTNAIAEGLV